ncbi:hypothetical protein GC170_21620 [bacterium]|nr:hypothetical protein [bacterium]
MTRYRTVALATLLLNLFFGVAAFEAQSLSASDGGGNGVACVLDIVVETRGSTGAVSTKTIHREFVLLEGQSISEDLSTRTRFEFLDASMVKSSGDKTVSLAWFADTSVFNSVDFATEVLLEDGDKSGRSTGSSTAYVSSTSIRTSWTLTCTEL